VRGLPELRAGLPNKVPVTNEKGEAEIASVSAKAAARASRNALAKAIELMHYRDAQIMQKAGALVRKEPK